MAALSIKTAEVRLHTSSLSPNTPKTALFSLPGELSCQMTQPFEDQAWEKRKEENEWRHHQFYSRLHILDKRLERGCRM